MKRADHTSLDFLRRVRRVSLILGALGVLILSTYLGLAQGAAALLGLLLSLVNLGLLEGIFSQAFVPAVPSSLERKPVKVVIGLLLKFPLLLGGTWIALGVLHLSPLWFVAGFTSVLAVILLKILGGLLVSPRTRGPATGRKRLWLFLGLGLGLSVCLLAPSLRQIHWVPAAAAQTEHGAAAGTTGEGHRAAVGGHASEAGKAGGASVEGQEAEGAPGAGHEGKAEAKGEESEPPELPSAFHILHLLLPNSPWAALLYRWQNPIYSSLVILFLCIIAVTTYRRRTVIPGKLQNVVELVVESFSDFILGILGPKGKEFIPFLGTLFLYIWLNNLQGLIPFFKSPTSVFNTTISLGICVFCYVQYTGITKLGIWGYLHHMMGSPQGVIGWCMVVLMLPLHLIEEVAKPISLSLRLFGNILGEDVLLGVFATLGVSILAFLPKYVPVGVPLHLPFIFLSLLMSTIQALVFTLLTTIYFSQMLPHEEEHEEHAH